jgi:hypothetical protein
VVLVLLTPHPEGGEHFDLNTGNHVSLWTTGTRQPTTPSMTATTATPKLTPTAGRSRGGGGRKPAGRCAEAQRRRGAEARGALAALTPKCAPPSNAPLQPCFPAHARVPDAHEDAAAAHSYAGCHTSSARARTRASTTRFRARTRARPAAAQVHSSIIVRFDVKSCEIHPLILLCLFSDDT